MKIPTGSHEIAPPPISDEAREAMFLKTYDSLQAFACALGGLAWQGDEMFSVGIERTGKIATSKQGIFDPEAYYLETVGFYADKYESGDPENPFFNVFKIMHTVSRPMDIADADPQQHEKLFDHFLEYFPSQIKRAMNTLAGPISTNLLTDQDEADFDEIAPEVRFDMCCVALTDGCLEFRLATTQSYTVIEKGQIIEFAEEKAYEIGNTFFTLVSFDTGSMSRTAVHSPARDRLAREYVDESEYELPIPENEKIVADVGELVLLGSAFKKLVDREFNSEDHGAIPYYRHIDRINGILGKIKF